MVSNCKILFEFLKMGGRSKKVFWKIGRLFILLIILFHFDMPPLQGQAAAFSLDEDKAPPAEGSEKEIDESIMLDPVVVTATRTERSASEVPASVSVIDSQTINDSKMMNIKDAMIGTPGVLIETKSQGYDSRLIIRGAGLKARYGIRDIMVLLDGVPITDPDSLTRMDFIDTQLIDQVEIVKGPNSTLWGANAAGGVINIITKNPMERKGGRLKFSSGSFDTYNTHLSYSGNIRKDFFYTVSGSHRQSNNSWRRWNEFLTTQGTFQVACVLNDGSIIDSYLGYTKAEIKLPGKLDETMFGAYKDTGKADETHGQWQFNGRYSEIFFVNMRLNKPIGAFELKPMVYLNSWTHLHPVTGKINEADTNTYGFDFQLNHSHMIGGIKGQSTAGFSLRYDDQKTEYFKYRDYELNDAGEIAYTLSDEKGELSETEKREAGLYGIYFQETLNINKRFILDAGLRFDKVKFDIYGTTYFVYDYGKKKYVTEEGDHSTQKSYDSISPRLGLVFKLFDGQNAYATISKGIKTPTESEISDNPDLKLPQIHNYEIGLKSRNKKWSVDTAFYYSTEEDEVIQVVQEDNETDYVNAGRTEKIGFEMAAMIVLPFYSNIGLNYSYTDYTFDKFVEPVRSGRNQENMDRHGNTLPYVPENQYSLFWGFFHPSGMKFRWQSFFWGEYYMDNANTEKYEGYEYITNLMIGYQHAKWEISLLVDNVFDKKYAVEVTKDTSGDKLYAPAAPLSIMLKCMLNF